MNDFNKESVTVEARQLYEKGRLKEALELYQQLCQAESDDAGAWMMRGVLLGQLWDFPASISSLQRAIELQPDLPAAYFHMAGTHRLRGEFDAAQECLEKAIQIDRHYTAAWLLRGEIQLATGLYDEAAVSFREVLIQQPEATDARIMLAETEQKRSNLQAAEENYRTVLQQDPDSHNIHYKLGQIYQDQERFSDAASEYSLAIKYNPKHTNAIVNLSHVYRQQNNLSASLDTLSRAIEHQQDNSNLHYNCGILLIDMRQYTAAEEHFKIAVQIKPDYALAYVRLGDLYRLAGEREHAIQSYRNSLRHGENEGYSQYMLSALGETDIPPISPAKFIRDHFDNYAERFDKHLVEDLGYRAPEQLNELVRKHLAPPKDKLKVLDLGCGTGLCGEYLVDTCCELTGVDLSPNMIKKAGERNIYNRLHTGEILEFLKSDNNNYNLIIAADVFIYIGKLDEVFKRCHQALNDDGLFAFSIETTTDHD